MAGTARVILVGGGPGDPGLLTLRGKEAIESAEVVLYDRLVGPEILALIPEQAEAIDVGKSSGRHLIPQAEINELIMRYVGAGKRVVRLKGGDPYLFGRGAEELEAVAKAGIPFEVVPGVTSAIAVPAYGGIPVSHRNLSSSIHIITGHPRHGAERSIHYQSLVNAGGTLIFLMGVAALPELSEGLIAAGMPADTPAALVENGTRPNQRKLLSTIGEIAVHAASRQFHPPAVCIVGPVCALSQELDWFSRQPLSGTRVLVTRPKSSAGTLSAALRELGCGVVEYPCIRTEPLSISSAVLQKAHQYHWIVFTSPVGAELFLQHLADHALDVRRLANVHLAAIGAKTAAVLATRGLIADYIPSAYNAAALGAGLVERATPGERVLLFRAQEGTADLPHMLREAGLMVDDIAAYQTVYAHPDAEAVRTALERGEIDYVTFTSASTVHGFATSQPGLDFSKITGLCIGPETATAAKQYGIHPLISDQATLESMIDCLLHHRQNS